MTPLITYVNEEAIRYELPEDYIPRTNKILTELVDMLPDAPFIDHTKGKQGACPGDGIFWFNSSDLIRSARAESTEYIGHPQHLRIRMDSANNQYNIKALRGAFNVIFDANITESVFDNNVDKNMPEYEWVSKLHDALCKFFKTNKLNNVTYEYLRDINWPSGIFKKKLLQQPTVEKEGLLVSLYNIDLYSVKENYEYNFIDITVFVYEKKDPKKLAEIKAVNDARKPLDVVGRELKEGDLVAFASIGSHGSYNGMTTAKVVKTAKDQVKLDTGKSVYAIRTCLIARKDGKMIE